MGTKRIAGVWIFFCILITGSFALVRTATRAKLGKFEYLPFNSIQPKSTRSRRAIDLSQEKKLISESRLPQDLVPNSYKLDLHPNFQDNTFHGRVLINATVLKWTNEIQLHSQVDMQIDTHDVLVRRTNSAYVEDGRRSLFNLHQLVPQQNSNQVECIHLTTAPQLKLLDKQKSQS